MCINLGLCIRICKYRKEAEAYRSQQLDSLKQKYEKVCTATFTICLVTNPYVLMTGRAPYNKGVSGFKKLPHKMSGILQLHPEANGSTNKSLFRIDTGVGFV